MRVDLQHVKVLNHCSPNVENLERRSPNHDVLSASAQLSLLDFIPPYPIPNSREYTPAFILATFSYISEDFQDPGLPVQLTVLSRWALQMNSTKLHTSFESLSSKKTNSASGGDLSVSLFTTISTARGSRLMRIRPCIF